MFPAARVECSPGLQGTRPESEGLGAWVSGSCASRASPKPWPLAGQRLNPVTVLSEVFASGVPQASEVSQGGQVIRCSYLTVARMFSPQLCRMSWAGGIALTPGRWLAVWGTGTKGER